MKPENIINMVKKYTDEYGVNVTWNETETINNSRGIPVSNKTSETKSAKVLLLKEKISPIQVINTNAIGLSQDYARYILTLPDIEIEKDTAITDSHNRKWKLGIIDYFDIGGVPVCRQASLLEVI
jgi:hypothetical protein